MLGFSIMMWFAALILFFTGFALLRGNLSAMHGKQFEAAKDKVGFGKAVGKIILFLSIGILAGGIIALWLNSWQAILGIVILFFVIIAAAIGWYAGVVRRY